jgi:cellulose synthase/poly-beta-1,6-N-acetylglucosamine synthase-like glycosyltransferase
MVIDLALFYTVFRISYYAVFVGLHISLMLGIFLEWRREKRALNINTGDLPAVSVVIPVHNESRRIKRLLESLEAQDYPRAEYIFIDDRSEDDSADLMAAFIEKTYLRLVSARIITLKENPGPNFKQYALARGIEAASGEFLLFTDADCVLPPFWILGMVRRMGEKNIGAAIGPVLKKPEGKGFFHLYQCFDHGIRYVYLAGATGLGAAGGGFGNNLILRRSCLDLIGGYDKVPPSPTEDAALISIIRSGSDYKIRAALGADVHVITQNENTWKDLINQTLRWNNGGLYSPDKTTRLNYNFLMITIAIGILTLPIVPFVPSIWPLPAGVLTSMIFNTIANLGLFGVSLPKRKYAYVIMLFFTPMFFSFLTILGFLGIRPEWKGKKI